MFNWYRWDLVIVYCILAVAFVIGILRPRKKTEWRSAGMAGAWVIALYAEMYGYPLTLYIASSLFGQHLAPVEFQRGHFWAPLLGLESPYWNFGFVVVGQVLILTGAIVALVAWRQLWKNRNDIAVGGFYRYIRHPQYTGFFLFIIGSVINWPTIVTMCMAPALVCRYYRLALDEEQEVCARVGNDYREYMARTGRFLPRLPRIIHKRRRERT